MKSILLTLTVLGATSFARPATEVNWLSIAEAQEQIKTSPKAIFIDFTAEWCGWCKVMDKNTFADPQVAAYMNENFYPVRLDYDSDEAFMFFGREYTARQLGEEYRVSGLPTILLIAHDNGKSKKLVGYKKPQTFLDRLKAFKQ